MTDVVCVVAYTDACGSYALFANTADGREAVIWDGRGKPALCSELADWDRSGVPCFWGGGRVLNPFPGVLPEVPSNEW